MEMKKMKRNERNHGPNQTKPIQTNPIQDQTKPKPKPKPNRNRNRLVIPLLLSSPTPYLPHLPHWCLFRFRAQVGDRVLRTGVVRHLATTRE